MKPFYLFKTPLFNKLFLVGEIKSLTWKTKNLSTCWISKTTHMRVIRNTFTLLVRIDFTLNPMFHASSNSPNMGLRKVFVGTSIFILGMIPTRMTFFHLNLSVLSKFETAR